MQFDDILKATGEFGRYQKIKYFFICLLGITTSFHALVSVFVINTPKHRCDLPQSVYNETDTWENVSEAHSALIEKYIPKDAQGDYEKCKIYVFEGVNGTLGKINATKECTSWVYDKERVSSSIVTQWDLVCEKAFYATVSSSMYMFGNLIGSFVSGIISDFLGRRKTLLVGIVGQLICGIVMSFAPEYYTFTIFRFLIGIFNMQIFLTAFVLGMEMIGPKYRLVAGIVIEIFWAAGFLILIAIGYFIRDWSYVMLAITIPCLPFISYYWLMPESARWLMAKGRNKEAEEIILMVAKTNGCRLQAGILEQIEEPKKPERLTAIRHAPRLLCRSLVIFFNWFVIAMSYYGLSLNSGNMPGSLHVNLTLSAVAEFVGYLLCFLCFVAGRKKIHVVSLIIGGLGCIASIPILYLKDISKSQQNSYFIALNTIGKLGVTIGFAIIYVWCAEIFPTLLRNSLMGVSSTFARVGSIFAPVIADIGKLVPAQYSQVLPPLIFGILTVSGGLLAIALPETTGEDLPETIRQANVFPKKLPDDDGKLDEDFPMVKLKDTRI